MKSTQIWQNNETPIEESHKLMRIYPNPAGSYYIVEYDLREYESTAILIVSDLTGRTIDSFYLRDKQNQQIFSTDSYAPGLYIVQMIINNELIETQKVEIIH
jgi:hypothetical protein